MHFQQTTEGKDLPSDCRQGAGKAAPEQNRGVRQSGTWDLKPATETKPLYQGKRDKLFRR